PTFVILVLKNCDTVRFPCKFASSGVVRFSFITLTKSSMTRPVNAGVFHSYFTAYCSRALVLLVSGKMS
ncbi:hypothetical protein GCK32_002859, partial [Trichostrongylus colubriformis]